MASGQYAKRICDDFSVYFKNYLVPLTNGPESLYKQADGSATIF